MSALIFRLRHVPEDEADAIRALLDEHAIEWYETSAGNWGIAMPGIWVSDDDQIHKARALIDEYQAERLQTQRALHELSKQQGNAPTLTQRISEHPLQILGIVVFCLFILYVSIHPFLQMIGYSRQ